VCLVVAWAGIASGIVRRDDVADNMLVVYCFLSALLLRMGKPLQLASNMPQREKKKKMAEVVTHTS
jgi:hypothetical protein